MGVAVFLDLLSSAFHMSRDTRAAFFQDFTQPIIRDKLSLRHILQQGIAKPLLFCITQSNIGPIEIQVFGLDDTRNSIQKFLDHILRPVPDLFLDALQGDLPG